VRTVLALGLVAAIALPRLQAAGPDPQRLAQSRARAVEFLKTSQGDDGNWTAPNAVGVTALALTALLENGVRFDHPAVTKALGALEKVQQKDGGIYHPSTSHKNYETCVAVMALAAARDSAKTVDPKAVAKLDAMIAGADKFLRGLQWDEGEGLETSDVRYGGAGYGRSARPDLSNTQFLVDALKAAGAKDDDPNIQKALVFVSRCQNLESPHNTTEFASKVDDGGFFYTAAGGGGSMAGKTDNGGLRSYGSMTYAGLKSMIYAGLKSDDPRVKAAEGWIRKHYTVAENPGMGRQGLYYYYHTFAKALAVMKVESFEDAKGNKHDWRKELAEQLFAQQQPNGSWVNPAERWLEGDPNLATAYNLLALRYCRP
jgi:squalene-hopene/tetraprenyl-beta-curcumene cyclase